MRVFRQPQGGRLPKRPSLAPTKARPPSPSIHSASQPREGHLAMMVSLLGWEDQVVHFAFPLLENSLEMHVPQGCVSYACMKGKMTSQKKQTLGKKGILCPIAK